MDELLFKNIVDFVGIPGLWQVVFEQYECFDITVAALSALLIVCGVYVFVGSIGSRNSKMKQLSTNDQSLANFYLVEAVVLTAQLPYYTYLFVLTMFSSRFDLVAQRLVFPFVLQVMIHAALYVMEVAIRMQTGLDCMVLLHHSIWFSVLLTPLLSQDVFSLKVGAMLDYFIVWESGIFWLLFVSKLNQRKLDQKQVIFGRISVGALGMSRLFQSAFLATSWWQAFPECKSTESLESGSTSSLSLLV